MLTSNNVSSALKSAKNTFHRFLLNRYIQETKIDIFLFLILKVSNHGPQAI